EHLDARRGLDPDGGVEAAGDGRLAAVDRALRAEEGGAAGVGAERGADRHVEHRLGGAGGERAGGDLAAGARGARHRDVVAVPGGDLGAGVDRRHVVVAAAGGEERRGGAEGEEERDPHGPTLDAAPRILNRGRSAPTWRW